jgi:chromosome segregation ATPase
MELADMISIKADSLQDGMLKIDQFNARIDALAKVYNDLENRIHELQEYETTITKNLESVNKADLIMKSIETRIKTFQSTVEKSEKKIERLTGYLHSIEENTLILKTREQEIREVKEHFAELEGLTAHIEERIKQVNAMFQKLEDMRDEISQTDNRLQLMFTETDKRMKQFADFLKAIDSNTVIGKEIKGIPNININERLIKTVRELSNKGWSSQEIANKLLIDENAVRLIINTSSM